MLSNYLFSLFFIIAFLSSGCQSEQYTINPYAKKMITSDLYTPNLYASGLYNKKWILQHTGQKQLFAYVVFKTDGKISGFSGCNKFFGQVSVSDSKISFGHLATTRKMCPKAMQFESDVLSGLSSISHYKIEHRPDSESREFKQLYLYNEKTEIFIFTYKMN